jgi:predicted GH43/DUF377 family glycosyl hydrolase
MIEVIKHGIILEKSTDGFENEGVLNPAAIDHDGTIYLFYRAVSKGNHSTIGLCTLTDPLIVDNRQDEPVIFPQNDYECQGVEDPRIVKIEDKFYLSYTAYDGVNALGAIACSTDLLTWHKSGIVVPQITYDEFRHLAESKGHINEKYLRYNIQKSTHEKPDKNILIWDKNVILFPRKINDKFYFLHRIKPDIQIACVDNLEDLNAEFWQKYFLRFNESIVIAPKYKHEVSYIGGGCPPIETKEGWLIIYHGVYDTVKGYIYTACAALLDLENPSKLIARLPYPLFKPEHSWEVRGEVNNVCFPTGAIVREGQLYIYYGAADKRIGCASINMSDLIIELLQNKESNE